MSDGLPELPPALGASLAQVETGEFDEFDAARQAFRHAFHQNRRGAAQDEKTRPHLRAVDQHAQHVEQRRHRLDFVQNHQSFQGTQRQFGVLQAPLIRLRFQIEVNGLPGFAEQPRQGGLAALPGAEQGDDRRTPYGNCQLRQIGGSVEHGRDFTLKIRISTPNFQGK